MNDTFSLYVPYDGPAGPTEQQVKNNNLALMDALQVLGFDVIETTADKVKPSVYDSDDPIYGILVGHDNKTVFIGYDRWGYVIELPDTEFPEEINGNTNGFGDDQVDIDEAIGWILENFYG